LFSSFAGAHWAKILYLCRYDLILPFPVTIVVKFGAIFILIFNLSAILGKNDFVIVQFSYVALLIANVAKTLLLKMTPSKNYNP